MNRYKDKIKQKEKYKKLANKLAEETILGYIKYWKIPKLITKNRSYYTIKHKMRPFCDLTFRATDCFDYNMTNVYNKVGRRKIEQMDKKYNYEWSNRNVTFNIDTKEEKYGSCYL